MDQREKKRIPRKYKNAGEEGGEKRGTENVVAEDVRRCIFLAV